MADYSGVDFYCDIAIPRVHELVVAYEDDDVLAFEHTRPFWRTVQEVAADVVHRTGAAAVTTNLGDYQDSKHLHFHVHAGPRLA